MASTTMEFIFGSSTKAEAMRRVVMQSVYTRSTMRDVGEAGKAGERESRPGKNLPREEDIVYRRMLKVK